MKNYKPFRYPRRKPTRQALLKIYKALRKHFGHRHWWPGETPFEVIVGAVLTQNTAWKNVEKAVENLKKANVLNLQALHQISDKKLSELIRPAGYFNVKTKRLKNMIEFLRLRYGGRLDKMFKEKTQSLREELLAVNGVGEETADSILLYAGNKPVFVVDAYTKRVFERHRYLKGGETYEEVQKTFMKHLPQKTGLYNDYHAQIVEVGKEFCRKVPRCNACPLRLLL